MLAAGYNKEYLPIEGLDAFRKATVDLLLGSSHPAINEVSSQQSLTGVRPAFDHLQLSVAMANDD